MRRTYTVIIRNYSKLFSFSKTFAINSKIHPPREACLHNAKLASVLGLSSSVQRAWKVSAKICSLIKKKKTSGLHPTIVDPTRTLALHILLRFVKSKDYQMAALLWAVFHNASLNLNNLELYKLNDPTSFKSNIIKQGMSIQDRWIQRVLEFIEGYADNLFQINAYVQCMKVLKCIPSTILRQRAHAEARERELVHLELNYHASKKEAQNNVSELVQRSTPIMSSIKTPCVDSVKVPWHSGSLYNFSKISVSVSQNDFPVKRSNSPVQFSVTPKYTSIGVVDSSKSRMTKSLSHPDVCNSCPKPHHLVSPDRKGKPSARTSYKRQMPPKLSETDNSKFTVRRFLPNWGGRQAKPILPAKPPRCNSPQSPSFPSTTCVSDINENRCYVCGLRVRGLWVVCSFCGKGGHVEHILSPDLKVGHFCTVNKLLFD